MVQQLLACGALRAAGQPLGQGGCASTVSSSATTTHVRETCWAVPTRLVAGAMVCRALGMPGWCREGLHIHALLIRPTAALSLTVQTHDQVGVFLGFCKGHSTPIGGYRMRPSVVLDKLVPAERDAACCV